MMKLIKYPSKEQWAELLKRPALNTESLFDTVRTIINKVRAEGDKAVLEYEAAFDKVTLSALRTIRPERFCHWRTGENCLTFPTSTVL